MEKDKRIYIERQKNYTKQRGTFGPFGSISGCGCGAVALYNVLTYFGIKTDFMTIVNRFNRLWPIATSFGGFVGTSIFHLYRELKHFGFTVYPIIFTKKTMETFHLDENTAFIFLYFWKRDKFGGHYQAGFGNPDGTITLHNPKATYFGIQDLLREKKIKSQMFVCLALMIHKKRK